MTLGERMKKLRKALGLTQQEFADKVGSKRNTIATYEMGRTEPSTAVISLICREFNVSETWLRTGEGEMFVERPRNEVLAEQINAFLSDGSDSFRERLVSLLLRLSPDQWAALERYARELIADRPAERAETAEERIAALERQNREQAAQIAALAEGRRRRGGEKGCPKFPSPLIFIIVGNE